MKKYQLSLTLIIILITSAALITTCEEAASNFTDRTIENLESEVGGAAERSRDRASDQAGGAICGSNTALLLLFTGVPAFLAIQSSSAVKEPRANRRQRTPCSSDNFSDERNKEDVDD